MNRRRKFLLGGLLLATVFVALFFSPAGVNLVRLGIEAVSGGAVKIGSSSGSLFGEFVFTDIRIGEESGGTKLRQLRLGWEPLALLRGELHLKKVVADGFYMRAADTADTTERPADLRQEELSGLPPFSSYLSLLRVVLDKGIATDFYYDRGKDSDGATNTSFIFSIIEISATAGKEGVQLRKLRADGDDMAVDLHGRLVLEEQRWIELGGTFRFAGFGFHPMAGKLAVAGALREPEVSVTLESPGMLVVEGKLHNLLTDPSWQAGLAARDFDLSLWIRNCPSIIVDEGRAAMTGDFAHYQGHALFSGSWDRFAGLVLEGDLSGNESFIDFATLALRRKEAVVEVEKGWISWQKLFDMRGQFRFRNINPALFADGFDGSIDGSFYTESGFVGDNFEGTFKKIDLQGTLHDQPFSGNGELALYESRLQTESFLLQSGVVAGQAAVGPAYVDWGEGGGWQASISLRQFDPASFFPEYGGKIDGEIESNGRFADKKTPFSGLLRVENLAGKLRGQKLRGAGAIAFDGNLLTSDGFSVELGGTKLQLTKGVFVAGKARTERKIAVNMDFRSPALDEVLPGARGAVALTADIHGTELRPAGTVTFHGSNLAWQGLSLHRVKGAFELQDGFQGKGHGELEAEKLQYGETFLRQLSMRLAGAAAAHRLDIHIDNGKLGNKPFSAGLAALGGFDDSLRQWQGKVVQGSFDLHQYGNWKQRDAALLRIGEGELALENFALDSKLATLFASLSAKEEEGRWQWQTDAEVTGMELAEWQQMLRLPVDITGAFSAELSVDGEGLIPESGKFLAEFPATVVTMENLFSQGESVKFTDGRVVGRLEGGLLAVTGGFAESGSGGLEYRLQAGEEGRPFTGESPLAGSIICDGLAVDLLGSFLSHSQPFGRLSADLSLGGSVARPKLSGNISLAGGVGILSQGISLKNPEITLDADPEKTTLHAVASSGDGFVNIDGRLRYGEQGVAGNFTINGDNFLAVDLPEYSFVVDPDMRFSGDLEKGRLTGKVRVVSGLIEPRYLPDTTSVSDDVIIVKKGDQAAPHWQFFMDVEVDLGDDIAINGYGVSGNLGGALKVKMVPEEPLSGIGTVDLRNGKFTMYGRSLDITRGNIIFSGGSMDNPGVDIRAEKSMSSQQALKEGYTVGVDISGLAQDLHYTLFSSPPMSETEILSYMVLGHSLAGSNAGEGNILATAAETLGVKGGSALLGDFGKLLSFDDIHLEGSVQDEDVSVVVGKRLTRDIYVGYDMNMYSQLGAFWVRYDLGRGFSVQTFSSVQSTGADLQFSFEK